MRKECSCVDIQARKEYLSFLFHREHDWPGMIVEKSFLSFLVLHVQSLGLF